MMTPRLHQALFEARRRIRQTLARSPVAEDPGHAENTLAWLLRLRPGADVALRLAALAHDIERARPQRLQRAQFDDYDAFKDAHARIGATIAAALLARAGVPRFWRTEVCRLIRHHETGGDARSDLIRDADSLSYFDHNLPFYFAREGWDETMRRARWGYARLSPRARAYFGTLRADNPDLQAILDGCAKAA